MNDRAQPHGPGPPEITSRMAGTIAPGQPMGGQFFPTPEMARDHNIVYPEYLDADTPDEIIKAVRQNVLFGAKVKNPRSNYLKLA